MHTFQSVVAALLSSLGEILPVGKEILYRPLEKFAGWSAVPAELQVAFTLGILLSLVVFFRYDLLSILSSFLRILLERRKPMTLDERMPFFLAFAVTPLLVAGSLIHGHFQGWMESAISAGYGMWLWAFLIFFAGLLLYLADYFGKHQRHIFDWNVLDTFVLGLLLLLTPAPGFNAVTLILIFAHYRNYRREAAAKFCYLALIPLMAQSAILGCKGMDFKAATPTTDVTWLNWSTCVAVAAVTTFTVLSSVMRVEDRAGYGRILAMRIVLALALIGGVFYGN